MGRCPSLSRGAEVLGNFPGGFGGGDGILSTLLEVVLGHQPAPSAAGDRLPSLPIPPRGSHQGPTPRGPCHGHPEVLSILLPPQHSPHVPPQASTGTWDQLAPKNRGQGSPTVLSSW